ncbi:hypothetical protein SJ05684_c06640 [Sinorhizobium sojae CCBAU 05684]|uniref:Uncharacterized protein n=1 Tax=Sinorhizobium sojae CCBAU 05684 TaxID=716928 RepID=A0A249P872_9HYPH|nr:hypothetical protein SJ05684_c06640 [Sinorhizobium sojae CCBAU 05684]
MYLGHPALQSCRSSAGYFPSHEVPSWQMWQALSSRDATEFPCICA